MKGGLLIVHALITRHPDWFCTYKAVDDGVVTLSNMSTLKVVGVGSIKLRMHDGVVRKLTNVKHVLNMNKNLLRIRNKVLVLAHNQTLVF